VGFVILPARIAEDEDVGEQDVVLEDVVDETALDVAFAADDADVTEHFGADIPAVECFNLHAARLVPFQDRIAVGYFAADAEILVILGIELPELFRVTGDQGVPHRIECQHEGMSAFHVPTPSYKCPRTAVTGRS